MRDQAASQCDRGGRPPHTPTVGTRNRVNLLLGLGWSNRRIATAIEIDFRTLKKHYATELRARDAARDRLDEAMASKLWKLFMSGNVAAGREFRVLLEWNDRIHGQPAPLSAKLGKKEQALLDAQRPDPSTPLGQLMLRRMARQRDAEVDRWAEGEPPN